MKTTYSNIFRICFTTFLVFYASLTNYLYIIDGFRSPNDGIEFVVLFWILAIYIGAISYHGYNDSYTWRSKHLTPTNICIGASIVGAIGSIGSLLLVSQLAFFILFILTSLMVMISLVLINSEFGEDAIKIDVAEENDNMMQWMANNLAVKFCDVLHECMTEDELNSVRLEESCPDDHVCTIAAMQKAWRSMFKDDIDVQDDAQLELSNRAWKLALSTNFNTNK